MAFSVDQVTKLMDLLKIPVEKQNYEEFWDQIQNLIEKKENFEKYYLSKNDNTLEKILNNPGLQHLAENIFDNLKYEDLEICRGINQSSKQILDHQMKKPMFWLRKFRGLSNKNKKEWIKDIESLRNSEKEKVISTYLQWNLMKDAFVDLPCYSDPVVQDDFRTSIRKICHVWELSYVDYVPEKIKILAPLTDNLNAPEDEVGGNPTYWAAYDGHTGIVKILAPLTGNAPNEDGETPIHAAASKGHTDIVKILAPLTDNLNAPDGDGYTPIYNAANNGHTEIVKFLAQSTGIPNPPNENEDRGTPIFKASFLGHTEIVKFLAPLTDNPNAPILGHTPIYMAAREGHSKIVKLLSQFTDNPNAPNRDGKTPSTVTKNEQIRKFLESFDTSRKRKAGLSKWTSKKKTKKF